MKIGYLVHDMNPKAGWGRLSSDLISGVKGAGHEVVILKEINDGFDGVPILRRGVGMLLSVFKARRYLKDCDVVHSIDIYPYAIIAFLASLFSDKKNIVTLVGTYSVAPLYNWKTAFLSRSSLAAANAVASISEFTKVEVLKASHPVNISVIAPGIDLKIFHKERSASKAPFIISVGALKDRKGYHNAIPGFAMAKKEIPDLQYKIVGSQSDSEYFSKLKHLSWEYGVEDSVHFLSDITDADLSRLYSEAEVFLLPSVNDKFHFEGFGIVFLEAAAAGLPVIGTKGCGIESSVDDGRNGFLVPQNDISGIAEAIIKIVGNREISKKMSANSYSWAKKNSVDIMVKKYLNLYGKVS